VVGKLLCTRICATLGCNCHRPDARDTQLQQTHVEKSTTCIVFTLMWFKSQFFTAL